jgi:protein tyrosine phosphatase
MSRRNLMNHEFFTIPNSPDPEHDTNHELYSGFEHINTPRVRYENVLPLKTTRVILNSDTCDFFEGNYIDVGAKSCIIAASAPKRDTFAAWYSMICDTNTTDVFCLSNVIEKDIEKMTPYWPSTSDYVPSTDVLECGCFHISIYGYENEKLFKYHGYHGCPQISKMVLRIENTALNAVRYINLYWYQGWSDFGVCEYDDAAVLLKKMKKSLDHGNNIVVHCSAGMGRTGVMCACIRMMYTNESRFDVVSNIRKCRAGLVQTAEQYDFITTIMSQIPVFNAYTPSKCRFCEAYSSNIVICNNRMCRHTCENCNFRIPVICALGYSPIIITGPVNVVYHADLSTMTFNELRKSYLTYARAMNYDFIVFLHDRLINEEQVKEGRHLDKMGFYPGVQLIFVMKIAGDIM